MIHRCVEIRIWDLFLRLLIAILVMTCSTLSYVGLFSISLAAAAGPTTSIVGNTVTGNVTTQVVPPQNGGNLYGIQGGQTVGKNLFHSFSQFNVGPGDIAQFQTSTLTQNTSIGNILGRITSQSPSSIFGTIDSATYYPAANLFLMNPYGFLFGPNATVNVGGMMTFTTADYIRLTNGGLFNANPNSVPGDNLLSADVVAFGFLSTNLHPAEIRFEGGQLTVAGGTGLTLVGGNINLLPDASGTPSSITAPGRPIVLTSVAGPGEVAADTGIPAAGMALGTITLGQGTTLSTVGDLSFGDGSGGPISIRAGQFVATGVQIMTSPAEGSFGSGGAVTVDVTGSASLTDSQIVTGPAIFSFAGSAGAVSITANDSLTMTTTTIDASSFFAGGDAGPVTLQTNGPLSLTDSLILTNASAPGNGGAVTLTGRDVTLTRTGITTDVDNGFFDAGDPAMGQVHPGAVTITAQDTVTLSASSKFDRLISAVAFGTLLDAGPITITGKTVNLSNGTIDASVNDGGAASSANGGRIEIRGNNINLDNLNLFSNAANIPESSGTGGTIVFRGADNLRADNVQLTNSNLSTASGGGGGGGPIEFQAKALTLSDHTDVGTSSFGPAAGGTITVKGAENVTIESGSRVLTDVVIGPAGVPQGSAGNILIETQNLTLLSGGQIGARALPNSTGNAGNIVVQGTNGPADSILIDGSGSGIFSTAQGTGTGGTITINANTVTMTQGAAISSNSAGVGDAGSINLTANNGLIMQDSSITTLVAPKENSTAGGGNIKITTSPEATVYLQNSTISASVADGPGGGGNISIDPQFVILQHSQILAQAAQGQGGAITITAGLFLPDANSVVNADSGSGVNGTVTIQSPNSPASGRIIPLSQKPLIATALLTQRCAALAQGNFSSFTVAGRDSLPAEPGSWLSTPLATLSEGMGLGARGEPSSPSPLPQWGRGDGEGETPILSLRQIAPPGFLTQTFAVDEAAGCRS